MGHTSIYKCIDGPVMSTLTDPELKPPKYLQLADYLRQQIDSGHLAPDDRLPSFTEMKAQFDATQHTVEKAHALLEGDGLIRRERRRGVFVNDVSVRVKTDLIAFLDIKSARHIPYHMKVQQGVREQAQACGKSITLVDDPHAFKHWKKMDGLILEDSGLFSLQNFADAFPPHLPMVRLFYPSQGMSSIMADDASGVAIATRHLLDLGHKRIGYLGDLEENVEEVSSSLENRHNFYSRAMSDQGIRIEPSWTYRRPHPLYVNYPELGYNFMCDWLKNGWRDLRMTALLAQNDHTAIGVIRALEENGINVPGDVSVVGFDGIDISDYTPLKLTTIVAPQHEIGATAMKVLIDHINQPGRPPEIIKLPVHLQVGESTAPPKTIN